MKKISNMLIGLVLILSYGYSAYSFGTLNREEPISDFIWVDNNRFHVDSIIDCQPVYDETTEQIGAWIRVSYKETTVFIECVDTEDYEWMEYRDSFLDNFRGIR